MEEEQIPHEAKNLIFPNLNNTYVIYNLYKKPTTMDYDEYEQIIDEALKKYIRCKGSTLLGM